jgi:4-hydroxythreonine-4-phosphate dehydrogenase
MAAPLAVTMGDPAGVGPDITLSAWQALKASGPAFFVAGDPALYGDHAVAIAEPADAQGLFNTHLPVLPVPLPSAAIPGQPDAANAPAVLASIEQSVALVRAGQASAVVTNPIAKSVLYTAGFRHPGHTEFIADLTRNIDQPGPRGPVMMLAGNLLRVALVSIHKPLRTMLDELSVDAIVHTAKVTAAALKWDFGIASPRLALAGLNPHAGEAGSLGREEIEIVQPAAEQLRAQGIDISDPMPPDAMFHAEARAQYDAAVCLYHDQGLIPFKALDFWSGVNVTLGLPIVRTSPDHGTGFDIAGQRIAKPDSLIAAIRMAADMAARRSS